MCSKIFKLSMKGCIENTAVLGGSFLFNRLMYFKATEKFAEIRLEFGYTSQDLPMPNIRQLGADGETRTLTPCGAGT